MEAEKFYMHLNNAMIYNRKLVDQRRLCQASLEAEIGDRLNKKLQQQERSERNSYQRKLKLKSYTISAIIEFPQLTSDFVENIKKNIKW